MEGRADVDRTFSPDPATVPLYYAAHVGKPYTTPLKLLRRVQALKHAKELVRVPVVKADTVIPDINDRFVGLVEGGLVRLAKLQSLENVEKK